MTELTDAQALNILDKMSALLRDATENTREAFHLASRISLSEYRTSAQEFCDAEVLNLFKILQYLGQSCKRVDVEHFKELFPDNSLTVYDEDLPDLN